eukprot:scaffold27.g5974.t1
MASLESVVAQIQGLSGTSADLSSLHTILKSQPTEAVLRANAGGLLTAVAALDATAHSLGCLYLLEAKGRGAAVQGDREFLDAAAAFLPAADPRQVRLAPEKFAALCRHVKIHAMALRQWKRGVLPLTAAVDKLCPSREHLSPVHADLFQLVLLSKAYSAASPLIDADPLLADPSATAITPTDVQLYCYYGGMMEIGRRRYPHALQLLLTAITAPTMVLSAISVAALKKWVLVSLLQTGEGPNAGAASTPQVPALPKWTPGVVTRALKSECGPYQELARLCGQGGKTPAELGAWAQGKPEFEQVGLSSAQEAELAVLRMVEAGQVVAAISERDGMVRFLDQPEACSSADMTARIDGLIEQSIALAAKLQVASHAVSRDRAYLARSEIRGAGASRGGGKATGGTRGAMGDYHSFELRLCEARRQMHAYLDIDPVAESQASQRQLATLVGYAQLQAAGSTAAALAAGALLGSPSRLPAQAGFPVFQAAGGSAALLPPLWPSVPAAAAASLGFSGPAAPALLPVLPQGPKISFLKTNL